MSLVLHWWVWLCTDDFGYARMRLRGSQTDLSAMSHWTRHEKFRNWCCNLKQTVCSGSSRPPPTRLASAALSASRVSSDESSTHRIDESSMYSHAYHSFRNCILLTLLSSPQTLLQPTVVVRCDGIMLRRVLARIDLLSILVGGPYVCITHARLLLIFGRHTYRSSVDW